MTENKVLPIQNIIYEIRGHKVMLDSDLAKLYGVETKFLNRAVKRNIERFPDFFMFQLTQNEWRFLRYQFGTLKNHIRKYSPYVFTEHGVLMLSSVLNSKKAISINIEIMAAFIKLRQFVLSQSIPKTSVKSEVSSIANEQIAELKKLLMLHIENNEYKFSEHDEAIRQIIIALNNLIEQPPKAKKIGFRANEEKE